MKIKAIPNDNHDDEEAFREMPRPKIGTWISGLVVLFGENKATVLVDSTNGHNLPGSEWIIGEEGFWQFKGVLKVC